MIRNVLAMAVVAGACVFGVAGCAERVARIPATATEVSMATGQTAYRATDSGTVYVYDRTHDRVAYTGYVKAGQFVTVDTRSNRILVGNVPVVENVMLDNDAQYSIYMDRPRAERVVVDRRPVVVEERRPVVERRTVVETRRPVVERRTVVEEVRPDGRRVVIERE